MANRLNMELKGQYLLFREKEFKPEYRAREHRIGVATGGFGCSPSTTGTAIFVEWADGGKSRKEGYQVESLVTKEEFDNIRATMARPTCPDCLGDGWIPVPGDSDSDMTRLSLCAECLGEGVLP